MGSLEFTLIALVFAIPLAVRVFNRPRRARDRDLAGDSQRLDVCRRRGWLFQRDDRRAADDKFIIWRVSGVGSRGWPWLVAFHESRDPDSNSMAVEFICSAAALAEPRCAFSTVGQIQSSRRGLGQVAFAVTAVFTLGTGLEAKQRRFFKDAALCECERPAGYTWAATSSALARALANDAVLQAQLTAVVGALTPRRGLPPWITWDSRGLVARAGADFVGATTVESLVDAMNRIPEVAAASR